MLRCVGSLVCQFGCFFLLFLVFWCFSICLFVYSCFLLFFVSVGEGFWVGLVRFLWLGLLLMVRLLCLGVCVMF